MIFFNHFNFIVLIVTSFLSLKFILLFTRKIRTSSEIVCRIFNKSFSALSFKLERKGLAVDMPKNALSSVDRP